MEQELWPGVSAKFLMIQDRNEARRRDNFKRQARREMEELILSKNSVVGAGIKKAFNYAENSPKQGKSSRG